MQAKPANQLLPEERQRRAVLRRLLRMSHSRDRSAREATHGQTIGRRDHEADACKAARTKEEFLMSWFRVGTRAEGYDSRETKGSPGGLPWARRTSDLGLAMVDAIGHSMTLDADWSLRTERGFTWWGKDLAQHVWAEPGVDDDGFNIFRLHARTDLLRSFKPSDENLAKLN